LICLYYHIPVVYLIFLVGKSIHKAAEAAKSSPNHDSPPQGDRRRSLGSAKRIVPEIQHLSTGPGTHSSPNHPVYAFFRNSSFSNSEPVASGSRKRRAEAPNGNSEPSGFTVEDPTLKVSSAGSAVRPAISSYHLSLDGIGGRRSVTVGAHRTPSGFTTPDRNRPQAGRKNASRKSVDQKKHSVLEHDGPQYQPIKAARKTSALHVVQGSLERFPGDSGEDPDSQEASVTTVSFSSADPDRDHLDHWIAGLGSNRIFFRKRSSANGRGLAAEHDGTSSDSSEARYNAKAADEEDIKLKDTPASTAILKVLNSDHPSCDLSRGIDSPVSPAFFTPHLLPCQTSALPRLGGVIPALSRTRSPSALASDEEADPPAPLIAAFESISKYTLHLHRAKRLPFLLRNVRTSFRAWCRELDIQSNSDASIQSRPQVPLTYIYTTARESYTYDTTIGERECPICSLFAVFPCWQALARHMRWDHTEVEFGTRLSPDVPEDMESIIICMKEIAK